MAIQDGELVQYALIGLEQEKRRIEERIAELQGQVGNAASASREEVSRATHQRGVSPAARKRMAEAQRARWAAYRESTPAGKGNSTSAPTREKNAGEKSAGVKSKMSAEARARISEAQKKRWAAARKGK